MAVEDKYNATYYDAAGKMIKRPPSIKGGMQMNVMIESFELAAADSDGSVYRLFKGVDLNVIPIRLSLLSDGITAGTVFDVGVYKTGLGLVIDADILASNMDLSSAADGGSATAIDGMDAVDIADYGKSLAELLGLTSLTVPAGGGDICLTGDTVGTAAGTVTAIFEFASI